MTSSARRLPLSANRSLVLDTLYFAQAVPSFPVECEFQLGELSVLRECLPTRVSWPAIFIKALGLVSVEFPELRQIYRRWPWPHLYEHGESVATLTVHREFQGEDRLCWARFYAPENQSLVALQAGIDAHQTRPVETIYRRQVRLSRLPGPLRRIGWRMTLYGSGAKRAKRLGTFSLSTLAGLGSLNRGHPSMLTSSLSYGPLSSEGRMTVTLLCDHRIIDGHLAARMIRQLETTLNTVIADELRSLARSELAA